MRIRHLPTVMCSLVTHIVILHSYTKWAASGYEIWVILASHRQTHRRSGNLLTTVRRCCGWHHSGHTDSDVAASAACRASVRLGGVTVQQASRTITCCSTSTRKGCRIAGTQWKWMKWSPLMKSKLANLKMRSCVQNIQPNLKNPFVIHQHH